MVNIRNRSDLKVAYEVLMEIQSLKPLKGREATAREHIRQLKKDIRGYLRQQEQSEERHVIIDDGIHGYTELVRLPEAILTKEGAVAYFEEKEALHCLNSPGGCTGHPFTCWYGIIRRQGTMWAYHRVSYDV